MIPTVVAMLVKKVALVVLALLKSLTAIVIFSDFIDGWDRPSNNNTGLNKVKEYDSRRSYSRSPSHSRRYSRSWSRSRNRSISPRPCGSRRSLSRSLSRS